MTEPEAELQATANLSPVSPSPVHTASPLVVPALQETVDTIDAMVAAVVASSGHVDHQAAPVMGLVDTIDGGDIVDDDPYGDDAQADAVTHQPNAELPASNDDDYAKTFDSPIGSDTGREDGIPVAEPSSPPNPSGALSSHPSVASHSVLDPLLAQTSATSPVTVQPEVDNGPALSFSNPTRDPPQGNPTNASPHSHVPGDASNGDSQTESSIDLQQLVANLTAQSTEPNPNPAPESSTVKTAQTAGPSSSSNGLPSSSSLPPRPPQPHTSSQAHVSQHHPGASALGLVAAANAPINSAQSLQLVAPGAPGTSTATAGSLPPPPTSTLHAPAGDFSSYTAGHTSDAKDDEHRPKWEQFVADERLYMSEAKWDRFPEGSRIFIGNLSSDKVSKRDVFEVFHVFGRLAQISLKSAYGFVQYHTVDEGHRAIETMEGAEIKGRRIHLEVSKLQDKSKKDRDRARSPDNNKARGGRENGRRNDRYGSQARNDPRGRHQSPHTDYNSSGHGRDRSHHDNGRNRARSRSPDYSRSSRDYRQRSPSPYGRGRKDRELDLPRRYGTDVPDVQIILQPDVHREFTAWVENTFKAKGLRTEVMFLHQRMPKDQVIQRQAAEGVHAVVDLDIRAQHAGKIPVQAFDRSAGASNVRWDEYVDLDPNIAAEVILRTKASSMPSYGAQPYNVAPTAAPSAYGNPYAASSYNAVPSYPPQPHVSGNQVADIANLIGKVDSRTLNSLLASLQGGAQPSIPPNGMPQGHPAQAPQHDIQALLNSLTQQQQPTAPPQHSQYGAPYSQPTAPYQAPANNDSAAQVQNIMAQLARYRQ